MNANDILYATWGWEQTNVDFYQVTKVTAGFVTLQKLQTDTTYDSASMTGTTRGLPDQYIVGEKPFRRKVYPHGSVRINSYTYAYLWDGTAKRTSHYA
jgi:hypothetical protein